jgi:hypothetical protein
MRARVVKSSATERMFQTLNTCSVHYKSLYQNDVTP